MNYKIIILLIHLSFVSNITKSQGISVDYDIDIETSKDMFEVLGIENLKFKFPKELQQKKFKILVKEYFEGEMLSVDSGYYYDEFFENSTTLNVIMYKKTDTTENVNFKIPPMSETKGPFRLRFERNKYEWASLIDEKSEVKSKTEIPFLTYTYEPRVKNLPNYRIFCTLPKFSERCDEWYDLFSVKHSFVFILKFDE